MTALATSTSEKLIEAKPRWSGQIGSGGVADGTTTTIPLASATNLDNGDIYIVVINRVNSTGVKQDTWETAIGELSGTNLINCVRRTEGNATTLTSWSAGTVVEVIFTAKHWNNLIDFLGVSHNSDGGHATDAIDAIGEIASALKTGSDTKLVTGTAGTNNYTAKWNSDGDLVEGYAVIDDDTMAAATSSNLFSGESIKAYVDANSGGILTSTKYAPRGFLINGKIVPSVSSNNLTVAIKGLDGNDPSGSNIVYVRIGDTVRQITSALSVTKNAGTNWFNSGQAGLATKERDYFVYLGYNATDGVTLGFSTIPYATEYDDFSATTTNEKYAAISDISNAASGDDYELIGRFAATLSAGAGYTWSVPTFSNKNLIQRPIYETRWLDWVPAYATTGTSFTNAPASTVSKYKVRGNDIYFRNVLTCNATSGGTGGINVTQMPFTAGEQAFSLYGAGYSSGKSLAVYMDTTTQIRLFQYDATTPIANNAVLSFGGYYAIA